MSNISLMYRKLRLVLRVLPAENFYAISVYESGIALQGRYTLKLTIRLTALGFQLSVGGNGYVCGSRNGIDITLTN